MHVMPARDITKAGAAAGPDAATMTPAASRTAKVPVQDRAPTISQLARDASVEVNVYDVDAAAFRV